MNLIIGFSKPVKKTFHGWLIEKVDNASFDHAYLRFTLNEIERDVVFQSIAIGVQLVSVVEFEIRSIPVEEYTLSISKDQFITMLQFCFDNAGKPYGLLDVLGLGISRLLNKIGIKAKNPFGEKGIISSEFCSQAVALCLNDIDPADFNLNADNISPSDLRNLLQQLKIPRTL